jgi:hypothetical protein
MCEWGWLCVAGFVSRPSLSVEPGSRFRSCVPRYLCGMCRPACPLHAPSLDAHAQDEYDTALFDHYGFSELLRLDVRTGETVVVGPSRMYIE